MLAMDEICDGGYVRIYLDEDLIFYYFLLYFNYILILFIIALPVLINQKVCSGYLFPGRIFCGNLYVYVACLLRMYHFEIQLLHCQSEFSKFAALCYLHLLQALLEKCSTVFTLACEYLKILCRLRILSTVKQCSNCFLSGKGVKVAEIHCNISGDVFGENIVSD